MSDDNHHWLVTFSDDPAMLERRKTHGEQHLEYLSKNSDMIKLAGGLRNTPETPFTGGAWIVVSDDIKHVDNLIQNDPYFDASHRKYDISYWGVAHNSM